MAGLGGTNRRKDRQYSQGLRNGEEEMRELILENLNFLEIGGDTISHEWRS